MTGDIRSMEGRTDKTVKDERALLVDGRYAHAFDVSAAEARAVQERLRGVVETADRLDTVEHVAGVDVGFDTPAWRGTRGRTRAAVAVLRLADLGPAWHATAILPTTFPYVPGLLSFRELPAVLRALARLPQLPDLLLCDGQGLAHPRRFGIACHLGVLTGLPAIGVAKSRLMGEHDEPPDRRGAWVPLRDGGEVIGAVLRTRTSVKPLYVSVGHRVCLDTAVALVMRCVRRYRLPETTRAAHHLASATPWEP